MGCGPASAAPACAHDRQRPPVDTGGRTRARLSTADRRLPLSPRATARRGGHGPGESAPGVEPVSTGGRPASGRAMSANVHRNQRPRATSAARSTSGGPSDPPRRREPVAAAGVAAYIRQFCQRQSGFLNNLEEGCHQASCAYLISTCSPPTSSKSCAVAKKLAESRSAGPGSSFPFPSRRSPRSTKSTRPPSAGSWSSS